jgi:hypothetical protein
LIDSLLHILKLLLDARGSFRRGRNGRRRGFMQQQNQYDQHAGINRPADGAKDQDERGRR